MLEIPSISKAGFVLIHEIYYRTSAVLDDLAYVEMTYLFVSAPVWKSSWNIATHRSSVTRIIRILFSFSLYSVLQLVSISRLYSDKMKFRERTKKPSSVPIAETKRSFSLFQKSLFSPLFVESPTYLTRD